MVNIAALTAELIAGHPDTGAYNIDDELATAELNVVNRTTNKTSMTGSDILNEIDKTEFNSLTDANKQLVWDIVHLGDVNPFGIEADLMIDAFGGGSTTITALQAARTNDVSRATELGFGLVRPGNVKEARA